MSKTYTAQEMREEADECQDRADEIMTDTEAEGGCTWKALCRADSDECVKIAAMLRQAADALECEKKYEFAEKKSDGRVVHIHDEKIEDVYMLFNDSTIVRREVGEWEEVKV